MRSTLMMTCLVLFTASGTCAQSQTVPPPGQNLDRSSEVTLLAQIPDRCVSINLQNVTISLNLEQLEKKAQFSLDSTSKNEADRLALIAAGRAKQLLKQRTDAKDHFGCWILKPVEQMDAIYLVSSTLEEGSAALSQSSSKQLERSIRVRYLDVRPGPNSGNGYTMFYILGGTKPFLSVLRWVS